MSSYALSSAIAGLNVAQSRINTISRNIGNATSDGYSQKTQQAIVGPTGSPFSGPVERQVDEALALAIREANGDLTKLDLTVQLLSQIETEFGRPEDNSSIPGVLKRLEAAFRELQTSPEKSTLYSTTVDVAQEVARTFNRLYERTEHTLEDTLNRIEEAVSDVNDTLEQIRRLNAAIASGGNGLDTTDLEDQRDQMLLKLSGLMDFTSFKQANGAIGIYSKQGVPLLDHSVHPISTTTIGTSASIPPAPPVVVIRSGALGGLLSVRDTVIPQIQSQLDDMARALTVAFNDPDAAVTSDVGVELFNDGGGIPLDPSDPVQMRGYARRISVNAAIVATPTLLRNSADLGDTTTIDKAVAVFTRTDHVFTVGGLQSPGNLVQVATDFVAAQSSARATAAGGLEHQKALKESFETKHSAKTGVNLDQEMSLLLVFQQAYAANARVIQTTKELYDALLAIR